jgi:nicotinate-nucleotide pyrophosphorylase (carboxylating)
MNEITMKTVADELILSALREDITSEDITTNSVMRQAVLGEVELICKEDGVIAGLAVFARTFELLDPATETVLFVKDGDRVKKGEKLGFVRGDIRVLLSGERTALNYLQRMSGIATYTRSIADLFEGSHTKLLDTRKTTPNMRVFEKYAVKVGGGYNHRYNLSDGILLKDNHIGAAGSVKRAVELAKEYAPFVRKIEIEVENLDMLKEALEAGADIIMLDNMSLPDMEEAVRLCRGRAETECSGNVTRENVQRLIGLGVDYVSSGALTHSAPILDLSLKNLHAV